MISQNESNNSRSCLPESDLSSQDLFIKIYPKPNLFQSYMKLRWFFFISFFISNFLFNFLIYMKMIFLLNITRKKDISRMLKPLDDAISIFTKTFGSHSGTFILTQKYKKLYQKYTPIWTLTLFIQGGGGGGGERENQPPLSVFSP